MKVITPNGSVYETESIHLRHQEHTLYRIELVTDHGRTILLFSQQGDQSPQGLKRILE